MAFQPKEDATWTSVFRQHMEEMVTYIFSMREQGGGHEFSPLMDIYEAAGAYVIEIDLPGFAENDFTVAVSGAVVRIEGVKRPEKSATATSYICLERHFGRFSRTIEIPEAFEPGRVQSRYERGVLVVTVPQR